MGIQKPLSETVVQTTTLCSLTAIVPKGVAWRTTAAAPPGRACLGWPSEQSRQRTVPIPPINPIPALLAPAYQCVVSSFHSVLHGCLTRACLLKSFHTQSCIDPFCSSSGRCGRPQVLKFLHLQNMCFLRVQMQTERTISSAFRFRCFVSVPRPRCRFPGSTGNIQLSWQLKDRPQPW